MSMVLAFKLSTLKQDICLHAVSFHHAVVSPQIYWLFSLLLGELSGYLFSLGLLVVFRRDNVYIKMG